ncbi:MAG: acyl carrier protein [Candidatus Orphnella occulta]|nr:acyl carrier protein [Candidatus Orphnella occulta]
MKNKKKEVTIEDIPDMLRSLISEHMNISKDKIGDNAHLIKDLGMNTLHSVQINIDLEDILGFEIPDSDMEKLYTFKQSVEYLQKRMEAKK